MSYWTYANFRDKVLLDLDLTNETFVTPDELVGLVNEGIGEAESEILKLNEDYFKTKTTLTMTNGSSSVSLPSNLLDLKIRGLIYRNGSEFYEVLRIREPKQPLEMEFISNFDPSAPYEYELDNASAAAGVVLNLIPSSRVTGNNLTMYYIRAANRIPLIASGSLAATEATLIDIPFINFLFQYTKVRVLEKEGGPRHDDALNKLEQQRMQMVTSLSEKILDNNTEVPQDLSIYWEHS